MSIVNHRLTILLLFLYFIEHNTLLNSSMLISKRNLQVTIALYLLWNLLGVSVLSGVAVVIFILPINFIITLATRKWQVCAVLVFASFL